MPIEVSPGLPYPLGTTIRAGGVNVAVVSRHAEAIELCLFDAAGTEQRIELPARSESVWHGFVRGSGIGEGLVYGLRARGPHAPAQGHRFDPGKLLLDPYAREIVGRFEWGRGHESTLAARVAAPLPGPAPLGVRVPAADTILYELHVKGFSKLNDRVPEGLRGTYAGLAHPASIEHLQALGVTTLSLLPVHYALSEQHLAKLGLTNYWGYNTLGWFCPDPRLSSQPDDPSATRLEFRAMVDALHAAGFEVVLDVVYNHSAEAGERGPTLSLRGLDNALYYRRRADDPSRNLDWTGCGNTLNFDHPQVVQLVLDSLRYWVEAMGVDGFRFDLAPVLARSSTRGGFDPASPLMVALGQDPILARAKLIAEPWDLGPEGYRLGHFPERWLEWNDRFRDDLRQFWLRRSVGRGELARRLAGSSDRFHHGLRSPSASINFVTAHDGFTLADLVSYAGKHNLANGEDNRDGHNHDFSSNCGVEGPSQDPQILARRARLRRALIASTLLAQGTPMLLAGDELGHSQAGNNNAYCQDNPIAWLDWSKADSTLTEFVRECIALRRAQVALRRNSWLRDLDEPDADEDDLLVQWRRPEGATMSLDDWHDLDSRGLGVRLGQPDEALLLLFNGGPDPIAFTLPAGPWTCLLASDPLATIDEALATLASIDVPGESLIVLSRTPRP